MPRHAVVRSCRKTEHVGAYGACGGAGAALRCARRRRCSCSPRRPPAAQTGRHRAGSPAPGRRARARRARADGEPLRAPGAAHQALRLPDRVRRRPARPGPGSLVRVYGHGPQADRRGHLPRRRRATRPTTRRSRRARPRRRSLLARVPRTALTGRLAVARADGTRSPATPAAADRRARPDRRLPAGVIDAEVQGHKVFFGAPATRRALLRRRRHRSRPTCVVELVRGSDGARDRAVDARRRSRRACRRPSSGTAPSAGKVQRDGVYQFRVTATDATGVRAVSSQEPRAGRPTAPGRVHASSATASRSRARTASARARRRSAAAAATRATTSSPRAARRSSPRAAAS